MLVTFFTDATAASKSEQQISLSALAKAIEAETRPAKGLLPWLKLARFGDQPSEKGSLRYNANLLGITGIEADYDGELIGLIEAVKTLRKAGIQAIVYTSPSYDEDRPRWRVLCPLSKEYPPSERDRFMDRLNGLFGGIFTGESWTLSQSYFYGSVKNNPSHRAVVVKGKTIDKADGLDGAIGKPGGKANGSNGQHGPTGQQGPIDAEQVAAHVEALLDNVRKAPDGEKHPTLLRIGRTLGGYLHVTGWTQEQAVEALLAALKENPSPVKSWKTARKTARDGIAYGVKAPLEFKVGAGLGAETGPQLPVIRCDPGYLDRMYLEAEAALLASGAPVFQRAILMKPATVEYDAAAPSGTDLKRKTHSVALIPLTAPALTKLLSQVALCTRFDARAKKRVICDPPPRLVEIILASRGDWKFPVVRGVLTTPTLRADGSLLITPGYDPVSRYYLEFPSDLVVPPIPERPTREQAMESLGRLKALLEGYAFVEDGGISRTVALTILVTQVLRCALGVSPLLAVSATAPGTGKSHLVDLASHIAIGSWCPIINAGKNDEETEKGINTKLISGIAGFSIDNVHRQLDLEALNTATERRVLSPRKFGALTDITFENGTVIYMTGNNLAIVDEQIRRTVLCRMDAKTERPELREFTSDLIAIVLADRGRYIADVLIVARCYITRAKRPKKLPPLGSYPEWSRFVREPLVWLGEQDPVLSQGFARKNDPVSNRLRTITAAWHAAFGGEAHTLAEAVAFATASIITMPPDYDTMKSEWMQSVDYGTAKIAQEALFNALREAFPAGRDGIDAHHWGNWLRRFGGRIVDGLKFVKEEGIGHSGGVRWRLSR